jgi:hypothetical protein
MLLAKHLISEGQVVTAQEEVWKYLDAEGLDDSQAFEVLEGLAACYEASRIQLQEFKSKQWEKLNELGRKHERLRPAIASLRRAFDPEDWPSARGRDQVERMFGSWKSHEQRKRMSALLTMIAIEFEFQGRAEQCFVRNLAAWQLDVRNLVAAAKCIELVNNHKSTIDPDGVQLKSMMERLDPLLADLLNEKNSAYARGASDEIIRLHSVLGMLLQDGIYEERGLFYQPEYHWSRAIAFAERIQQRDAPLGTSRTPPGGPYLKRAEVRARLSKSLRERGDPKGALAKSLESEADFRSAALSFIEGGYTEAARTALINFESTGRRLDGARPTWLGERVAINDALRETEAGRIRALINGRVPR